MLNRRIDIWLLIAACLLLTGCGDSEADNIFGRAPVNVQLGYIFGSASSGNQTRQAADVVQSGDYRREISKNSFSIIPMRDDVVSFAIASGLSEPVFKENDGPSKYYHYAYCSMRPGVNRCLVYAKAVDEDGGKVVNGSLTENQSFESLSTDGISFAPESIYPNLDVPSVATQLASALNGIANITGWKNHSNDYLKLLFNNFTNHGNDLPGSAASVRQWIATLRAAAEGMKDNESLGLDEEEKGILTSIIQEIDDATSVTGDYPRGLNLPDGAAVLRWAGEAFVPQLQTTTIDDINSVSRFAYPAALYYFGDSPLRTTSDEEVNFSTIYNNASNWSEVLNYFPNSVVSGTTKSAVLEKPVQYGVAQLKLKVKADETPLKDADGTVVPLQDGEGENLFPLTGIIVCGQRPVGYDFAPKDNSDADVKFMYDSQVTTGSYLTTDGTPQTTTLVLQSYDGEDVIIILEFENKSDKTFKCVDGYVYPDTRFYLIGTVEAAGYNDSGEGVTDDNKGRVFTKDYTTEVNMKVVSLAKAYNVMPNILSGNFEIGIETTPKWIAAEPTNLKLY